MSSMYLTIKRLCDMKGITGYRMCKDLNISPSLLTDLKNGRRTGVNAETGARIANYFGVTIQYLTGVEEDEKKPVATDGLSDREQLFYDKAVQLTPERRAQLESYLDFLLSTQ